MVEELEAQESLTPRRRLVRRISVSAAGVAVVIVGVTGIPGVRPSVLELVLATRDVQHWPPDNCGTRSVAHVDWAKGRVYVDTFEGGVPDDRDIPIDAPQGEDPETWRETRIERALEDDGYRVEVTLNPHWFPIGDNCIS